MKQELDFIVIGAAKAGTTSLFEYLRAHPQIAVPDSKEAPYFTSDDTIARGWPDYMDRIFGSADPARRWGTVTPQYMFGAVTHPATPMTEVADDVERTVPRRIRDQLPGVRLVAILRDPVQRAQSDHRMNVLQGTETRSFDQAVEEQLQTGSLQDARRLPTATNRYVIAGEYGRVLGGYFDVFGPQQLLVLFTDELSSEPERVIRQVYDFLGVSADFSPRNLGTRYGVGAQERRIRVPDVNKLRAYALQTPALGAALRALPRENRRQMSRALDRVHYRLDLWNRRSKEAARAEATTAAPSTIDRLRNHFLADADLLTSLLGRTPTW